jgi:hypothetical protein
MKATFTIWLCFALASSVFSAGSARNEAHDVSIIRLIASPDDYAGKLVRVVGYLNVEFEGDAIYLHEEDFQRSLTTNALSIKAKPEMMRELKKLDRQYVILEGVFDPSDHGHMGLFSGAIENITRADSWAPTPTATASPGKQ